MTTGQSILSLRREFLIWDSHGNHVRLGRGKLRCPGRAALAWLVCGRLAALGAQLEPAPGCLAQSLALPGRLCMRAGAVSGLLGGRSASLEPLGCDCEPARVTGPRAPALSCGGPVGMGRVDWASGDDRGPRGPHHTALDDWS